MAIDHLKQETIENSCQKIINSVRSFSLNFTFQETPFSIYFSVRKSLNKSLNQSLNLDICPNGHIEAVHLVKSEKDKLQSKIEALENANANLQRNYEESIDEAESIINQKNILEEILNDKLADSEKKIEAIVTKKVTEISVEKKALQMKHEKVSAQFKELKHENDDLKKEINNLGVALKSSKKEHKEIFGNYTKKIDSLETKLKDLHNYKVDKISEEKDLKTKLKKVDKKLKNLNEREAKLKVEKDALKTVKTIDENANLEPKQEEFVELSSSCTHSPQCLFRHPRPPPHGPPTLIQFELQETVTKNEIFAKIETFTDIIKNFFHSDPNLYDIDITIAKLEALKGLYGETSCQNDDEVEEFDQTIKMARETQDIIEHLKKKKS